MQQKNGEASIRNTTDSLRKSEKSKFSCIFVQPIYIFKIFI